MPHLPFPIDQLNRAAEISLLAAALETLLAEVEEPQFTAVFVRALLDDIWAWTPATTPQTAPYRVWEVSSQMITGRYLPTLLGLTTTRGKTPTNASRLADVTLEALMDTLLRMDSAEHQSTTLRLPYPDGSVVETRAEYIQTTLKQVVSASRQPDLTRRRLMDWIALLKAQPAQLHPYPRSLFSLPDHPQWPNVLTSRALQSLSVHGRVHLLAALLEQVLPHAPEQDTFEWLWNLTHALWAWHPGRTLQTTQGHSSPLPSWFIEELPVPRRSTWDPWVSAGKQLQRMATVWLKREEQSANPTRDISFSENNAYMGWVDVVEAAEILAQQTPDPSRTRQQQARYANLLRQQSKLSTGQSQRLLLGFEGSLPTPRGQPAPLIEYVAGWWWMLTPSIRVAFIASILEQTIKEIPESPQTIILSALVRDLKGWMSAALSSHMGSAPAQSQLIRSQYSEALWDFDEDTSDDQIGLIEIASDLLESAADAMKQVEHHDQEPTDLSSRWHERRSQLKELAALHKDPDAALRSFQLLFYRLMLHSLTE